GKGNLGGHNRFTHYPCSIQKAIKINCGSTGIISNMIPSLQHVYTVSFLLDKVEYIPRQNIYDKPKIKKKSAFDIDVEEKWRRLRPMDNREYHHPSYRTDIALEQPETDATFEYSKSAYYYMFNRVYEQWKEVTNDNNQEHLDIISYKNSRKIPRRNGSTISMESVDGLELYFLASALHSNHTFLIEPEANKKCAVGWMN
ncbi:unnamed protein product, partial [Adineta steineri]